jgi:metallo-beta-lactamase family protein
MLQDSAHLMEEAAERERRHARDMKRPPRPPLYTRGDAERAVRQFRSLDYSKKFNIGDISVRFSDAGHILGSTIVEMDIGKKRLVFSGDLGRPDTPILRDPQRVDEADWLVLESTYCDNPGIRHR